MSLKTLKENDTETKSIVVVSRMETDPRTYGDLSSQDTHSDEINN